MWSASEYAPYQVGVTYLTTTSKKLDTSIFYPMDKQENPNYDALWFRDPTEAFTTFKREVKSVLGLPMIPDCVLRPIVNIKIPATIDGKLCDRFDSGKEAMRPLIFAHGLGAEKAFYTAACHAMAASGYLVIAVNH